MYWKISEDKLNNYSSSSKQLIISVFDFKTEYSGKLILRESGILTR